MLHKDQLRTILSWAKSQQSKSGDLLARARQSLLDWDRVVQQYHPVVEYRPVWFGYTIQHRCSCPAWKSDRPCKHIIALILLDHKEILSHHSKWKAFFEELSRTRRSRPPRVPKEFENF